MRVKTSPLVEAIRPFPALCFVTGVRVKQEMLRR